ncbi:MAG TPA: hypothetical protein VFZ81_13095 [Burkholderiales bacterium]
MPIKEFESLLETVAGLAAANIVMVETLHEHGILDKTHFAHAFGRALDTLAPEHRGGMIEQVLQNLRDRCMNLPARGGSDAREWLDRLLATHAAQDRRGDRLP